MPSCGPLHAAEPSMRRPEWPFFISDYRSEPNVSDIDGFMPIPLEQTTDRTWEIRINEKAHLHLPVEMEGDKTPRSSHERD